MNKELCEPVLNLKNKLQNKDNTKNYVLFYMIKRLSHLFSKKIVTFLAFLRFVYFTRVKARKICQREGEKLQTFFKYFPRHCAITTTSIDYYHNLNCPRKYMQAIYFTSYKIQEFARRNRVNKIISHLLFPVSDFLCVLP